jgi:hypothetical protein
MRNSRSPKSGKTISRRQLNRTAVGDHAAVGTRLSISLRSNKVDRVCQKRIGAAALPIRETAGRSGSAVGRTGCIRAEKN